jgi:hypothetical protein
MVQLSYRSKLSIKWGKAEKAKADNVLDDEDDETDDTDIDMSGDEEEPPDLYRNSALGM